MILKKLPMITLLAAPYIFVFAAIIICIIEEGFTANALGYIGYEYLIMLMVVLIPNMLYAFILKRNGYNHRDLFLEHDIEIVAHSNFRTDIYIRYFYGYDDFGYNVDSVFACI